jgi:hypothetical protein
MNQRATSRASLFAVLVVMAACGGIAQSSNDASKDGDAGGADAAASVDSTVAGVDAKDAGSESASSDAIGSDASDSAALVDASVDSDLGDAVAQDRAAADANRGPCPDAIPSEGGPCDASIPCEYGGNAMSACTTVATCQSAHWNVAVPAPGCGQNSASCPAAFDPDASGPCVAGAVSCDYPEGRCACTVCARAPDGGIDTASSRWGCRAWNDVPAGCPVPRPLVGTQCTTPETTICDYGWCCGGRVSFWPGAGEVCSGGIWVVPACTVECIAGRCM